QPLGRLAGWRDLDLHALQVRLVRLLLALGTVILLLLAPRLGIASLAFRQRLAPEHRARRLLLAHQPQPSRAAGEQLPRELAEVLGCRLEGFLKAALDLAIGVGDHRPKLAHRVLEVFPPALHLLDVGDRLGVLLLGQWIDRAELLAPALQTLEPRADRLQL